MGKGRFPGGDDLPRFSSSYSWHESLESIRIYDGDGRLDLAKTAAARERYKALSSDFDAGEARHHALAVSSIPTAQCFLRRSHRRPPC